MESYLNLLEESFLGIKRNIVHLRQLGFEWGAKGKIFIEENEGKAISHVAYLEIKAWIEKQEYKVGFLHGICTQAFYRNKGYASKLILKALDFAKQRDAIPLLFTEIPDFYTRMSFKKVQEYRFHLPCEQVRASKKLRPLEVPHDKDLFFRCFQKREPLSSRFWIQDDGYIASFNSLFATYPLFWSFYYSEEFNGLLSFEIKNKTLHLFDVVAEKMPPLKLILSHFQAPLEDIYFYFPPERLTQAAQAEPYLYDHGQLMVYGAFPQTSPFMVAPLSRC